MKVQTIEDIKVLIPNQEHENFTEGAEIIPANAILEGELKVVKGKRKGEDFNYKLFLTNDGKLIYINKLKNMEEQSGIDTPAKVSVNLKQNTLARPTVLAALGGAALGFGYAKYKKHEPKKALMYSLGGAILGFVVGKMIEHKATVKVSK